MAAPNGQQYLPCDDFLKFQDSLKKLRLIDDRIIHALNTKIPTQSFRHKVDVNSECKRLYDEMQVSYDQRDKSIRHCLELVSNDVKQLRQKKMDSPDDVNVLRELRKEQTKLRLMQQEMSIEEVVKDRTLKVFYERCRDNYTPPAAPIVM
ncbi:coiled-coil domain-containing protein 58 isoform X2 [Aplysia californica]|uniref:Protein MIX23 n=1 Tax=Aplysia californica TaxID=6500 RepID=A0ABM0JXN6_APLCA|nr:coiled-coil domain-containing protein 58 isoform X1 [Aplysia californica]XP_012941123.1 coiled-coil domain-containing protein 58 isoform X2 [Aplysia californica]